MFIVGNGSAETGRSNAFVVKKDGSVVIDGAQMTSKNIGLVSSSYGDSSLVNITEGTSNEEIIIEINKEFKPFEFETYTFQYDGSGEAMLYVDGDITALGAITFNDLYFGNIEKSYSLTDLNPGEQTITIEHISGSELDDGFTINSIRLRGKGSIANGESSLGFGRYNTVEGKDSIALGYENTVVPDKSVAIGRSNKVYATNAFAFGR